MWCAVLWLILPPGELFLWLLFTPGHGADVLHEDNEDAVSGDDDFPDLYDTENNDTDVIPAITTTETTTDTDPHARVRRFGDQATMQTLSHYDLQEVEGALKEIMAGRGIETLTTTEIAKLKNSIAKLTSSDKQHFQDLHDLIAKRAVTNNFTNNTVTDNETSRLYDDYSNENNEADDINTRTLIDKENRVTNNVPTRIRPFKEINPIYETRLDNTQDIDEFKDIIKTQHMKLPYTAPDYEHFKPITLNENIDSLEDYDAPKSSSKNEYVTAVATLRYESNIKDDSAKFVMIHDINDIQLITTSAPKPNRSTLKPGRRQKGKSSQKSTFRHSWRNMPLRTANNTKEKDDTNEAVPAFDMPALLDIISNLTMDYETNLTRRFNETFQKFKIPTCETPGTIPTTTDQYNIENASVVGKCFVCGLTTPAIPGDAFCADAFAGDFLPLLPVDPRARGQIARYRKYCRYLDVSGVMEFPEEPRSMFGRFTGGCSVRWIDLSGVYTQRACRNRRRSHTGKHFLSKRMAKLEMALSNVDNGCIVSPMASLVPLSRGISLYARFHACVCTGSWCNRAVLNQPWMLYFMFIAIWTLEANAT